MFSVISDQQAINKSTSSEVRDSLQYFGMASLENFLAMQSHLEQAALQARGRYAVALSRPTIHGGSPDDAQWSKTHGPTDHGGRPDDPMWHVYWPCVLVHCCEAKQTLNTLGIEQAHEILSVHCVPGGYLRDLLLGGVTGHDCFMLS